MIEIEESLEPKVTIAVLTYNHEKFIRQAIESILIQTYTNYEILISDDCSTDHTMDIIKEYQVLYPEKFKIMCNKENIGSAKNFRKLLNSCDGDYVAMLDGDDFWIHPEKLKLQVDFLEFNQDYSVTFHQARILKMDKQVKFGNFIPAKRSTQLEFTIEDVMNELFMPTASVLFRNNCSVLIPEWFEELIVCDKPLHLINLTFGKVKYIDECMCIYRVHNTGIWSTNRIKKRIEFNKNKIKMLNYFNEYSKYNYNEMIKRTIKKCELKNYLFCIKNIESKINAELNKVEIDNTKTILENFFLSKEVYIFGTGEAGLNSFILLNYSGTRIKSFIDNDKTKQGTKFLSLPVNSPAEINLNENTYIVVGSMYYDEIKAQLIEMGLKQFKHFTIYTELLITIDDLKKKGACL